MTITVYPVDAVSGAPSYTGRKARQALSALAAGARPSRPLGGLSGVRPGSGVVGSATSTTWTVTPHAGQLDLQAAAEASVYLYAIDANVTGTMTAADGTNPRVDIVYVTLNDPAEGDGSSTPGVTVGYLAGAAAASPSAPATPARSSVLFTIAVPKAGGGSPTVTMAALEVGGAGAPVGVRSQAQRDALTPSVGAQVKRLDASGYIERWTGTAWEQQNATQGFSAPYLTAQTVPATTVWAVKWDTATENTVGLTITSTFILTVTKAGVYQLSAGVSVGNTQNVRGYIDLYGGSVVARSVFTTDAKVSAAMTQRLAVGDVIKVELYCGTATGVNGGFLNAYRIGA